MGRAWLYAVAALAGLAAGWLWNGSIWGERYARLERDHARHIAAQQQASADVISGTLLRERELQIKHGETEKNAAIEKEKLERDLADSNAVALRMQQQLDDISGRISADTGTDAECEAARATAGVLADMHARLDEAAGVYAEAADRAGIAGRACEAAYEAAKGL